jgi:hypothetical protein
MLLAVMTSLLVNSPGVRGQVEGFSIEPSRDGERFHTFTNLLTNGDFELDDDVDGFPNEWLPWPWVVEEELELRNAIFEYLETTPDAVIRPRLTTRFPFFGKRSLNILSIDGKTGPGVYVTREFKPGIYTISLYAKNPGEGKRNLGLYLGTGGRIFEVGRRWRNIIHTEITTFHIKDGEVSLRDWTFSPGELLIDRVVLLKLPFDVRYDKRMLLNKDLNNFVIDFTSEEGVQLPIGINLEIKTPSGEFVRKNIEGLLEAPEDQVVFQLNLSVEGLYRLKVEIYDLRTADVVYTDDDIEVVYQVTEASLPENDLPVVARSFGFFPVGIRAKDHELVSLKGMEFNSVLITEPDIDAIDVYRKQLNDSGMHLFYEVTLDMYSNGCNDEIRNLITASKGIKGFSGWFIRGTFNVNPDISESQREVLRCLSDANPVLPIIMENYLPNHLPPDDSLSFVYVALDPNLISVPSRPLFTMGHWADRLITEEEKSVQIIGMPQIFGGWPIARRTPTYPEVRAMTYLSVLHGAKGIIYRDFSSLRPYFDRPDASWDIRKVPDLWEEISKLNRELNVLSPYFLTHQASQKGAAVVQEDFIDYGLWREGESLLLVAVNVYDGEVEGKFLLDDDLEGGTVDVLFEERTIETDGKVFTDNFSPFDTHVYRFTSSEGGR